MQGERGKEFLQGEEMKVTFLQLSAADTCYKIHQRATSTVGQSRSSGLRCSKVGLGSTRRKISCGGYCCRGAGWKRNQCSAAATLSAQPSVPRLQHFLGQMCTMSVVFDLKSPGIRTTSHGEARGGRAGGAQP